MSDQERNRLTELIEKIDAKREQEAAAFLAMSTSGLRKLRKRGVGPRCFQFGRLIRYRMSDLIEWMEAHMVEGKENEKAVK